MIVDFTRQNQNTIIVIGRLTRDPELETTAGGHKTVNFTVAQNNRKKDQDTGEWEDGVAIFFACKVWRKEAEMLVADYTKGDQICVYGAYEPHELKATDEYPTPKVIHTIQYVHILALPPREPRDDKEAAETTEAKPRRTAKLADAVEETPKPKRPAAKKKPADEDGDDPIF